ncbi:MAG: exodeoxyribonuclease VII small subunit [Alphaproteobacteria bacterium]|nr:exodeoxyribonuclease VII small subunit [Alphaproteobacteria bacterium]
MAKKNLQDNNIALLGFEEALAELQNIVKLLEKGESKLDEAIEYYERGNALKKHCEQKLREAQMKIDRIIVQENGDITTESLNFDIKN